MTKKELVRRSQQAHDDTLALINELLKRPMHPATDQHLTELKRVILGNRPVGEDGGYVDVNELLESIRESNEDLPSPFNVDTAVLSELSGVMVSLNIPKAVDTEIVVEVINTEGELVGSTLMDVSQTDGLPVNEETGMFQLTRLDDVEDGRSGGAAELELEDSAARIAGLESGKNADEKSDPFPWTFNNTILVLDLDDRSKIQNPQDGQRVFVEDATDDPSLSPDEMWAGYRYVTGMGEWCRVVPDSALRRDFDNMMGVQGLESGKNADEKSTKKSDEKSGKNADEKSGKILEENSTDVNGGDAIGSAPNPPKKATAPAGKSKSKVKGAKHKAPRAPKAPKAPTAANAKPFESE